MPNLTAEQQTVVRNVVKGIKKDNLKVISMAGHAGTGKTTCLSVIAEVFPDFAVCAFTGKAADVLRKKGMESASTIHSLIYKLTFDRQDRPVFVLKDRWELSCGGFVVDEASMISRDLYDDLLSFDLPVLFCGDHGQLEPIGQDINVMADPMFVLETIHRNAGEIAFFAEHIRKGKPSRTFQVKNQIKFVDSHLLEDNHLCETDQIICAFNKTRVSLNDRVRKHKGYKGLLEPGERIMCLRNNNRIGLFNGMQGEVTRVNFKKRKLDFQADDKFFEDVMFDPNQFGQEKNQFEFGVDAPNPFDYAYCITAHRSQGSEWDNVLAIEQKCDKWDHKRWAYTVASRAKKSLTWVCPKSFMPNWL